MSDIHPGDVVVCVTDPKRPRAIDIPQRGKIYRVSHTYMGWFEGAPDVGLWLVGMDHSPTPGYSAQRFRKIRPADPEFVSLVKRVRVGEPA